jgi:SAM-dependent methyltransferase
MRQKRSHKDDKLAKVYDAQVFPLWTQYFARLILDDLSPPPKASILDVGCQGGYVSLEIERRLDADGRIIAIEPSPALLDEARLKAGTLAGKRIYFRTDHYLPRLSFADDVFDIVISCGNELEEPTRAIDEFTRVTKEGGRVVIALPLAGTYQEFFDILREVLIKRDYKAALERLDLALAQYPTVDRVQELFRKARLDEVTTELTTFTLLFKSSREFFFSPIIEYGPLSAWKAVAGKGQELQDIFWLCKEAIDLYWQDRAFAVTVVAGCVRGAKLQSEAARRLPDVMYTPTAPLELNSRELETQLDDNEESLPFSQHDATRNVRSDS